MINFMRRNKTLNIKQMLNNSNHCVYYPFNYIFVTKSSVFFTL